MLIVKTLHARVIKLTTLIVHCSICTRIAAADTSIQGEVAGLDPIAVQRVVFAVCVIRTAHAGVAQTKGKSLIVHAIRVVPTIDALIFDAYTGSAVLIPDALDAVGARAIGLRAAAMLVFCATDA